MWDLIKEIIETLYQILEQKSICLGIAYQLEECIDQLIWAVLSAFPVQSIWFEISWMFHV